MLYMAVKINQQGHSYRVGRRFKTKDAAIRYAQKHSGLMLVEGYHGRRGKFVAWTNYDGYIPRECPGEFSGAKFA